MSLQKKLHLINKLRSQGEHEEANRINETAPDDIDFTDGIFAGVAASELMSDFGSSESISTESSADFSGEGGISDGGGAGGDY